MGATVSSVFCRVFRKKTVKILMVGLHTAGKTTILYKLKLDKVVPTIPTIGFNVEVIEHKNISFIIYDIGGGFRLQKLWIRNYDSTHGLIFVIDSNDQERIEEIKNELECMLQEEHLKDAVVLILANKQDLPGAMTIDALTHQLFLNHLNTHRCHIQAVSAINGDGLHEGLDWLSSQFVNN